jgi:hypothetical protein
MKGGHLHAPPTAFRRTPCARHADRVLSLSRGIILFSTSSKNKESLKQSHGLEVVAWRTTLSQGIHYVPSVKVRITDGTFSELCSATGNETSGWIGWTPPDGSKALVINLWDTSVWAGAEIMFDDLLARMAAIYFEYQDCFDLE